MSNLRIGILSVVFSAVLLLAGCKAQGVQTGTSKSAKVDPHNLDNNGNLIISMERTGCFGRCPIYQIRLYENGFLYYEATRYTDTTGKFYTVLNKKDLAALVSNIKAANLMALEDQYPVKKITPVDLPTCIITYHENGKTKRILDRGAKPDELGSVERQLDDAVKSRKLQNCDK